MSYQISAPHLKHFLRYRYYCAKPKFRRSSSKIWNTISNSLLITNAHTSYILPRSQKDPNLNKQRENNRFLKNISYTQMILKTVVLLLAIKKKRAQADGKGKCILLRAASALITAPHANRCTLNLSRVNSCAEALDRVYRLLPRNLGLSSDRPCSVRVINASALYFERRSIFPLQHFHLKNTPRKTISSVRFAP